MLVDFIPTIISDVVLIGLAAVILANNARVLVNRALVGFIVVDVLWLTATSLLVTDLGANLIFARSIFALGILLIAGLNYFIDLLSESSPSKRRIRMRMTFMVTGVLLSMTPYVVSGLSIPEGGGDIPFPEYGSLYPLWSISLFGLLTETVYIVWKSLRESSGLRKSQIQIVAAGIILFVVTALLTNVVIPAVLGNSRSVSFAPFGSIVMVGLFTYAIVRHQLFDVRAVVARTITYVLVLALFLAVYTVGGFIVFQNFFVIDLDIGTQVFFFVFLILLIVAYNPVKKFFDKASNRLFYRDAYDPQQVLDKLNQTLVSNVDLDVLLTKSSQIIYDDIKSSFCTFYLYPTSYLPARIIGIGRDNNSFTNVDIMSEQAAHLQHKAFMTVDDDDSEYETLSVILKENDIDVLIRLVDTAQYQVQGVGLMVLGRKKSGSSYSKKDLQILETIANGLVIAIENVLRYEEIDQFNVTLQKKIDDATRELKQSNEKLKALDEAKDEFVSMASHQLRTPLTSIKGYVSMVSEEDVGKLNKEQKKMLGQALFSSQRMVYLISDLLNVSRLKTGKFVIEPKPVFLPDIIESELEQLKEGAQAKDITFIYEKPKEFSVLNLDEMKIRQVIMNFTDNAIYYTPTHGKITIELKDKKNSVEFLVKDTGIGVPKSEQHKLFTKFYRAGNARKARPDGTGLGLFMAKKVIIAQGGSVVFESKEGKGSTFGFSFPKDKLLVAKQEQEKEEKDE